jgi:hypothetical protein
VLGAAARGAAFASGAGWGAAAGMERTGMAAVGAGTEVAPFVAFNFNARITSRFSFARWSVIPRSDDICSFT